MSIELRYDAPPSTGYLYRRLLLKRRPGLKPGESLPAITTEWPGAQADSQSLQAYRDVCGFKDDGRLPITYPQVLCNRLQMAILAHETFPLSAMGALHLRNHIVQFAPIASDAMMHMECRLATSRVVKAGLEFDINTSVREGTHPRWEAISTYLVRGKKFGEPGETPAIAAMPEVENAVMDERWHVPKNMGKRYAKISGDYNPIHVSRILAKLFGFKRDIIHGMWTLARTLSTMPELPGDKPRRCDASFKGPIFMDHDVLLQADTSDDAHAFAVYCQGNDRPSLQGGYRLAADGERLIEEA